MPKQSEGRVELQPAQFQELLRTAMARFLQSPTPDSASTLAPQILSLGLTNWTENLAIYSALCKGLTGPPESAPPETLQQNRRFVLWFSRVLFSESEQSCADALHSVAVGLIGEHSIRLAVSLLVRERAIRRCIHTVPTDDVNSYIQLAVAFDTLGRKEIPTSLLERACRICDLEGSSVSPARADLAYRLLAALSALHRDINSCLNLLAKAESLPRFQEMAALDLYVIWVDAICSQAFVAAELSGTLMFVAVQAIKRLQNDGVAKISWTQLDLLTPQLERTPYRYLSVLSTKAVLRYVDEANVTLSFDDVLMLKNNHGNALLSADLNAGARETFLDLIALASIWIRDNPQDEAANEVIHQIGVAWSGVGFSLYNLGLRTKDTEAREAFLTATQAFNHAESALEKCGRKSFRDARMWACRGAAYAHLGQLDAMLHDFAVALLGYDKAFKSIATRDDEAWGNFMGMAVAGEISGLRDNLSQNVTSYSTERALDLIHVFLNPDSDTRLKCAEGSSLLGLSHLAVLFAKLAVKSVYETSLPDVSQILAETYVQSRSDTLVTLMNYLALAGRYNEAEQLLWLIKKDRAAVFAGRADLLLDAEANLSLTRAEVKALDSSGLSQLMLSCGQYGQVDDETVAQLAGMLRHFESGVATYLDDRAFHVEQTYQTAEASIHELLDSSSAFLRYLVTSSKTVIVVYTGGERVVAENHVRADVLAALVTRLRQRCRLHISPDFSDFRSVAGLLYHELIEPLAHILPDCVDHLLIDCGPLLQGLPFAALCDRGRYLVEDYALTYVCNAVEHSGKYDLRRDLRTQGVSFYLCSNLPARELPGVKAEGIASVRSLDSANIHTRIYKDGACSSRTLIDEITNPQIRPGVIHLATHASFNVTSDLLSNIALNDGNLSLRRLQGAIQGSDCHLPLLVLSACGTARADIDVEGFAVTLLRAGVGEVLATLWETVDMSGPQLFSSFYDALAQSEGFRNTSSALRDAQIALIRSNDQISGIPLQHPTHWAPYVVSTGI
jgi:CHAT domain-containing protein